MPRTVLSGPTVLTPNSDTAVGSGTTIDSALVTAGLKIPYSVLGKSRKVLIRVTNSALAGKVVTIKTGVAPSASGDYATTAVEASGERYIVLETGRFAQADGSIWIDFASGHTGVIEVVKLP